MEEKGKKRTTKMGQFKEEEEGRSREREEAEKLEREGEGVGGNDDDDECQACQSLTATKANSRQSSNEL